MRLEYGFELSKVEVPRFSVEAVEGIGKLFTLAALILNVFETKDHVEIVFHGLNPEDPETKIGAFKEIVAGSEGGADLSYRPGSGGRVPGSSSYFRWITVGRGVGARSKSPRAPLRQIQPPPTRDSRAPPCSRRACRTDRASAPRGARRGRVPQSRLPARRA